MKITSWFWFLTLSPYLNAQNDLSDCKKIVLVNDVEISATIDQAVKNDFVIYRACPDTSFQQYNIPVHLIKIIRNSKGNTDLLNAELVSAQSKQSVKAKKKPVRNWMFKNEAKKIAKTIAEEDIVSVTFLNTLGIVQKMKGKWKQLTEKDLVIESETGASIALPRSKIKKITQIGSRKGIGIRAGIVLIIIAGIIAALVAVSNLYIDFSLGGQNPGASSSSGANSGCGVLPFFLLFCTLGILLILKPNSIADPFGSNWEINYPAPEMDQKGTFNP